MANEKGKIITRDLMMLIFYGIISYNAVRIANTTDRLSIQMATVIAVVEQHEKRLDKGGL